MHLRKDGDFYTVESDCIAVGNAPKEQKVFVQMSLSEHEMRAILAFCVDPSVRFWPTAVVYLCIRAYERLRGRACCASIKHTLIPLVQMILRTFGRKSDLFGYSEFKSAVIRLRKAGLIVRSSHSTIKVGDHFNSKSVFQTIYSPLRKGAKLDYSIADAYSAGNDFAYSRRTTVVDVSCFFGEKQLDSKSRRFSIVGENKKFIRKALRRKKDSAAKICNEMVDHIVGYESRRIRSFETTLAPDDSVIQETSHRVESVSDPLPPGCSIVDGGKFLSELIIDETETVVSHLEDEAASDVVSVMELDGSGGSYSSDVVVPRTSYCREVTTRRTVRVGYWNETLLSHKGDFEILRNAISRRASDDKNLYLSITQYECKEGKVDLRSTNGRESSCLNLSVAPLSGLGGSMNPRGVYCLSLEGKSDMEKALIGAMLFNAFTGRPLLKSFFSTCLGGSSEIFEIISWWIARIDKHIEDMSDVAFREIDELRKYAKISGFCARLWKDTKQVEVRPQLRLIIHMLNEEKLFGGKSNFFASNVRRLLEKIKKDPEAFLVGVEWARYLSKSEFDLQHSRARRREKWEKHNGKGREARRQCVLMFASVVKKIQNKLWSYRIEANKIGSVAKKRLENNVLVLCRKDPTVAVNLYYRTMKYLLYLVEKHPDLGGTREETYFALNFKEFCFGEKQRRYFSSETFKEIVDINKAYSLGLSSEELSSIVHSSLNRLNR